jgi:hypothetical protein
MKCVRHKLLKDDALQRTQAYPNGNSAPERVRIAMGRRLLPDAGQNRDPKQTQGKAFTETSIVPCENSLSLNTTSAPTNGQATTA